MHRPHDFCPYCGAALSGGDWPRVCTRCSRLSYLNPAPVAVLLLPVDDGLLVVRRGIDPQRGKLALPGGFIDIGESWQEACARELWEETGTRVDAGDIGLLWVASTERHVMVFGLGPPCTAADLPPFVPHEECTERQVITAPQTLAFERHTEVVARFFDS